MRAKPKGCPGYWDCVGLLSMLPVRAMQFSDTARSIMCIATVDYGTVRKGDKLVIPTVEFKPF